MVNITLWSNGACFPVDDHDDDDHNNGDDGDNDDHDDADHDDACLDNDGDDVQYINFVMILGGIMPEIIHFLTRKPVMIVNKAMNA